MPFDPLDTRYNSELNDVHSTDADPAMKGARSIVPGSHVEHYDLVGNGCAREFAERLSKEHAADLLRRSLNQRATDACLTELAERLIHEAPMPIPRMGSR